MNEGLPTSNSGWRTWCGKAVQLLPGLAFAGLCIWLATQTFDPGIRIIVGTIAGVALIGSLLLARAGSDTATRLALLVFSGLLLVPAALMIAREPRRPDPRPSISNSKQMGLAYLLYKDAHDGRCPPPWSWRDSLIKFNPKAKEFAGDSVVGWSALNAFQPFLTEDEFAHHVLLYTSTSRRANPIGVGIDTKWLGGKSSYVMGDGSVKKVLVAGVSQLPWYPKRGLDGGESAP